MAECHLGRACRLCSPDYVEGAFFHMGVEALGTSKSIDQGKEMRYSGIDICAYVVCWGWRAVKRAGTCFSDCTEGISII